MLAIQTDRLVLRDFQRTDLPSCQELCSHPEFQRFYPEQDASPEEAAWSTKVFAVLESEWGG